MKRLLLLTTLLLATQAHAFECKGLSINYVPSTAHKLNNYVAMADRDKRGNNIVYYATDMLPKLPKKLQEHVWAHECAHLKLNHVGRRSYTDAGTIEDEADCHAIKLLEWKDSDVDELIEAWRPIYSFDPVGLQHRSNLVKSCIDK
jgi:tRNA A37 threonylcarbamoyladenosine modification protein TsaB